MKHEDEECSTSGLQAILIMAAHELVIHRGLPFYSTTVGGVSIEISSAVTESDQLPLF